MTTIPPSAINATIAELMEPKPPTPHNPFTIPSSHNAIWKWVHSDVNGIPTFGDGGLLEGDWQPLDFLHDARGTVIIIKRMILDEDFEHFATRIHDEAYLSDLHDSEHWNMLVAHAFLRANGIEVSE